MTDKTEQEYLDIPDTQLNNIAEPKMHLIKQKLRENIENIDTASGKIVIENGFMFLKQLKAEAKRQEEVKRANMTNAAKPIEELPIEITDPELDRLADSMEIIEEDDD